jgi:hypothetical protein
MLPHTVAMAALDKANWGEKSQQRQASRSHAQSG